MATTGRIEELRKRYEENQRRFFAPLANEYRKAGDLEQAIAICRMHLEEAPANLSGQIVFGQALFEAGTLDDARHAFETAIGLDPENLIALRHLGDIGRLQSDIPRAREWYQRVLDADRRNEEVTALMAELEAESPTPPAPQHLDEPESLAPPLIEMRDADPAEPAPIVEAVADIEPAQPEEQAPAPIRTFDAGDVTVISPPRPLTPAFTPVMRPTPVIPGGLIAVDAPTIEIDVIPPPPPTPVEEMIAIESHTVAESAIDDGAQLMDFEPTSFPVVDAPVVETEHVSLVEPLVEPMVEPMVEEHHEDIPPAADTSFGFDIDLGVAESLPVAPSAPEAAELREVDFGLDLESPSDEVSDLPVIRTAEPEAPVRVTAPRAAIELEPTPVFELDEHASEMTEAPTSSFEPEAEPIVASVMLPEEFDAPPSIAAPLQVSHATPIMPMTPIGPIVPIIPVISESAFDFALDVPRTPLNPMPAVIPPTPVIPVRAVAEPTPIVPMSAIGDPTPIMPMTSVTPTPVVPSPVASFATETMAELYVRQGLRQEAIGIYRQLVSARPDDLALAQRLAELEHPEPLAPASTARSFFAALSARRATPRMVDVIPSEPNEPNEPSAPTEPRQPETSSGSLDKLFGRASVSLHDETAARALAAAYDVDAAAGGLGLFPPSGGASQP